MNRVNNMTFSTQYDFVTKTTKVVCYISDRDIMVSSLDPTHKMEALKYLVENLSYFIQAEESGMICYPIDKEKI